MNDWEERQFLYMPTVAHSAVFFIMGGLVGSILTLGVVLTWLG